MTKRTRVKRRYSTRLYHFDLPYTIPAMYLFYGINQLKQGGVWQKMPGDLQAKWQKAADEWHSVRVTKEDLDRIDDESWKTIAEHLNVKWEIVK